jgi:predicted esterase
MEPIVVWRRPAKRGASTPLVVLLHGRGADENDLIDLANGLPRGFRSRRAYAPPSTEFVHGSMGRQPPSTIARERFCSDLAPV